MANWIDYNQIQDDLVHILTVGPTDGYTQEPAHVAAEVMERDRTIANMPFISINLISALSEPRSLPNEYNEDVNLVVEIVTFHFTDQREAVTVRSILVSEAKKALQQTPQFSAALLTSIVGPETQFQAGTLEGEGASGFVAAAAFDVVAQAYIDN